MIIREASNLPVIRGKVLVLDFETSSGDKKKSSVNPWFDCRIAGTGLKEFSADGSSTEGFYVPTGHCSDDSIDGLQNRCPNQIDPAVAAAWLYDSLQHCDTLIGQNFKYDAHVLANNWDRYTKTGYGFSQLLSEKNWIDTLTHAKLVDSDRWSYGLKKLSVDWLGHEDHSDPLQPYLKNKKGRWINQDFGQIPIDVCGPYCIEDLHTTAELELHCRDNMLDICDGVWETEQKLTKILWYIEKTGMRIDVTRLEVMAIAAEQLLVQLQEELCDILKKDDCRIQYIRPAENVDCFDVLCSHYGLPVLEWTAGGKGGKYKKPSFNKHALKQYLFHPKVSCNEVLKTIVEKVMKFRKWTTINDMFLKPYQELHIDGLLHGDFNQCIRTGRMAMMRPNMQQVPKEVRALIVPYDQTPEFGKKVGFGNTVGGIESDELLVARDASQIEFRIITHYCRNPRALAAYNSDATTDYHQFVADDCGIDRSPAKNINFMLSFGGGKYKTLHMLKDALDLLGEYDDLQRDQYEGKILTVPEVRWKASPLEKIRGVKDRIFQKKMELEGFEAFCWVQASAVYANYHRRFPEVKRTSYKAADILRERGYVKNLSGRVRRLPKWAAHKAFNNLAQSSAADMLKERVVALWESVEYYKGFGPEEGRPKLLGLIHDEIVTSESRDTWEQNNDKVMDLLCSPKVSLSVPVYWSVETGTVHWGECK